MTYYKEIDCTDEQLYEWGVDYDTAYFMKNGKNPLPRKHSGSFDFSDFDREHSDNAYREYQQSNFDEYFTGSYKYCLFK